VSYHYTCSVGPSSVLSVYLHMKNVYQCGELLCGSWKLADFLVLLQIRAFLSCAVLLSKQYVSVVGRIRPRINLAVLLGATF